MTDEEVIDLGWAMCKQHEAPAVFLWLADQGWERAMHVQVIDYEPDTKQVHLKGTRWSQAWMAPVWSQLN